MAWLWRRLKHAAFRHKTHTIAVWPADDEHGTHAWGGARTDYCPKCKLIGLELRGRKAETPTMISELIGTPTGDWQPLRDAEPWNTRLWDDWKRLD